MKKISIIIFFLIVVKTNFAQNKKEQIIILQNSIDSIKTVFEKEIVVKKNLSSNIDSITKSILNEYKLIKDLEELNKSLKSKININNKMYDSFITLIQTKEKEILDAQKELKQINEAAIKEKEDNENDSKQKIDLSISKNINDITIDSSTFKNGNKIPEENKLPVNSKKLYYVRGKFKDIEWGDFAHYLFHRNDGQSIYFWHSDVLNRFRLEDDSPNTQLKDKMFDIFFSVENINLNPESDEIKDFHKFYVVKKIIPIR
jgi:tRNA A37 threonylcarbamoyladenosine biosynthesis protein TsaE